MILITGAGGKTGKALIKALSRVESVCAFVYHDRHASIMKSLGAERVVIGDMHDESVLRSVMQGMRAVYHVCPNMSPDEVVMGKVVIEESRRAGVRHFVYHSVLHPQTQKMHHHWQKLRVEEMIFESGLPFTIFQPAPYMQNLLAGWKSITEDGVLRVPYSVHSRFSFVDLEDIGQAATTVLTDPGHLYATYELAGTYPLSPVELAGIVEQALNRDVRAGQEEIGDWKSHAQQSGMPAHAVENLVRMFEYYHRWGLVGNPNVLRWILKREPASWTSFIQRISKEDHAIA